MTGIDAIDALPPQTGRDELALDPAHGRGQARLVAWIDPAQCIGCTRCIRACPVDAIIGAPRRMHTVIAALCTGCDLCAAPCPVDCIAMTEPEPALPWRDDDARAARARHDARRERLARRHAEVAAAERKRATIEAAVRRAHELAIALPARQPRAAGANDGPAGDSGDCA